MDKHITVVGVLNIAYRGMVLIGAGILLILAAGFAHLFDVLLRTGSIRPHEVPVEILDIVPAILLVIASLITTVSILGIVGAIGVLQRKEWGRIILLIVSFFNLLHIPLGTVLGGYSIWVLLSDETIALFNPASAAAKVPQVIAPTGPAPAEPIAPPPSRTTPRSGGEGKPRQDRGK